MEHQTLPGLSDFIAVASLGGVNAASRATQIPKATLSRRVRGLETALGTRLLERGGRHLRLTEEGRVLLERAAPLMSELQNLYDEVSGSSTHLLGPLRISAPSLFAKTGLGKLVADFSARYPDVIVDIDIADTFVDPVRDGYDMVIRANPAPDTDLVGKCFLRSEVVLVAPPHMSPPPDAAPHKVDAVVLSAQSALTEWVALGEGGEIRIIPRPTVRCSSMMVVHDAARHGAGAALLPRILIEEDLAQGRLVEWGVVHNRRTEAWALHASSRLTSPKVRAFIDMLVDAYRND